MQFYEPLLVKMAELSSNFKHPEYLWGIPVAFLILLLLVSRNFVRYGLDERGRRRQRRLRIVVFTLRLLAVSAILIALATPFTTLVKESEGDPRALILVDESASMDAYDTSFVDYLTDEIGSRLPTSVKTFGSETLSPVGDATLGNPEHVLLISDGNANTGVDILDVAQVARQQNLTISTVRLSPLKDDAAIVISAPQSVPVGFPAKITVEVTKTIEEPVPVRVTVDGKEIYNQRAIGTIELEPQLAAGHHRIEARVLADDDREENNVHYRTINILEKPEIFVLSDERGALERALEGMFDVTVGTRLPSDLSPYYTIVVNDESSQSLSGESARLADFLRDEQGGKYGGGLVVFGGFNSYDRGGYGSSQLESLLPVKVGRPKRDIGENSLVFVIQISGSTGGTRYVSTGGGGVEAVQEDEPTIETIKAQAVSAINSLNLKNNVGVVVFGVSTAGQDFGSAQEALESSVVRIADVRPLYTHKQEITDKIPRLQGGGTTAPDIALRAAVDMLKDKSGEKTIIFLTNGRFSAGLGAGNDVPAKANTLAVVENAYRRYGINTQTIGVGSSNPAVFANKVDEQFLTQVAAAGESTYDRATNLASLTVKYGDPEEKGFGENFNLVPLSLTHFITRNVELTAILNGFNEVAPKDGSRLLVSTDSGLPAVTVWNYFNGRVASVTVFTASGLGPLLSPPDSDLVRNTVLWAVGDPERKQDVTVRVPSALEGERAEVVFTSDVPVGGECADTPLEFVRSSGREYVFSFEAPGAGFHTVCGIPYAVNSNSEFWRVGQSERLETAVQISEGGVFDFDQIDEIVERIRTVSSKVSLQKTEVRNPFLALGIVLFLLEIFIRRLTKTT